jgi:hypothetical protein
VNLYEKNIRKIKQTYEILLSNNQDADSNSSNVFKYLELGIYPVRFEIMKRKVVFLQYILQQEDNSMMSKVLKATRENPIKGDFVKTCTEYLETLDIGLSFEEIRNMSKYQFTKLVKKKTTEAAFKYLMGKKNQPGKQTKIEQVEYETLEIQEYLVEGNKNTELSQLIFKTRGKTLEIKAHKKWKYKDNICVGCERREETEEEFLSCAGLSAVNENISYNLVYGKSVEEMMKVAKCVRKRLKTRLKILEEKDTEIK